MKEIIIYMWQKNKQSEENYRKPKEKGNIALAIAEN